MPEFCFESYDEDDMDNDFMDESSVLFGSEYTLAHESNDGNNADLQLAAIRKSFQELSFQSEGQLLWLFSEKGMSHNLLRHYFTYGFSCEAVTNCCNIVPPALKWEIDSILATLRDQMRAAHKESLLLPDSTPACVADDHQISQLRNSGRAALEDIASWEEYQSTSFVGVEYDAVSQVVSKIPSNSSILPSDLTLEAAPNVFFGSFVPMWSSMHAPLRCMACQKKSC